MNRRRARFNRPPPRTSAPLGGTVRFMLNPRQAATLIVVLAALGSPEAAAQDRPGDWTIVGAADAPGGLRASLWLSTAPGSGGEVTLTDALGLHAAAFFAPTPRTVVVVEGTFADPDQVPALDWQRATLTPGGGAALAVSEGEPWTGHPAGLTVTPPLKGGALAIFRVPFPALEPACGDVTFAVPVADGEPLVVRFRRWRDLLAEAEADLAAWKRHIAASRAISAIPPYLEHPAFRRLIAHGEPTLPALLLRELARGEAGDADAVPRFLVLHVLAGTAWGRAQGVPDHGDEVAAARVLARWRELGQPAPPGISPEPGEPR